MHSAQAKNTAKKNNKNLSHRRHKVLNRLQILQMQIFSIKSADEPLFQAIIDHPIRIICSSCQHPFIPSIPKASLDTIIA
jgi:hypothetical protein